MKMLESSSDEGNGSKKRSDLELDFNGAKNSVPSSPKSVVSENSARLESSSNEDSGDDRSTIRIVRGQVLELMNTLNKRCACLRLSHPTPKRKIQRA